MSKKIITPDWGEVTLSSLIIPDWRELFMRQAYLISSKSKDFRTKMGAVLVMGRTPIVQGYNGIPAGVNDNVFERNFSKEKHFWYEHAERNAIFSCARLGISALGSVMYTQGTPCKECSRAIIQAGISEVIIHQQWQDHEDRMCPEKKSTRDRIPNEMLSEAGVVVKTLNCKLHLKSLMDGEEIDV